ncbi:hypothetical protein SLNSH_09300 [Alsobacter soli]|uniref:Metallopeptidase n=1 Tax=Alsobacter soli TaxID=2109933 RepID=A0A2T1HUP0_9HYPH|nr:DUF4344 domain-containing metallopeptidase [Alsobacter soli]PSC05382.1 hypothetical protein SLNSH_09300 [Alsobacter soli]
MRGSWTRALLAAAVGTLLGCVAASAKDYAVQVAYEPPKNPAHEEIAKQLREHQALEKIRDHMQGMRFPRPLTIKVEGCDGDVNAAYDPDEATVSICYEYLAYIQELSHDIPPVGLKEGLTPSNYVVGPFYEVVLHELAHAIFDLKKVPVLGREEDAADQVATFVLLHIGKNETRRVIASLAVMYAKEAQDEKPGLKQFADEHGLPAQRFFNLLCMSYGADPKTFGDLVDRKYLPSERAGSCSDEYKQVRYAVQKLIAPGLDWRPRTGKEHVAGSR